MLIINDNRNNTNNKYITITTTRMVIINDNNNNNLQYYITIIIYNDTTNSTNNYNYVQEYTMSYHYHHRQRQNLYQNYQLYRHQLLKRHSHGASLNTLHTKLGFSLHPIINRAFNIWQLANEFCNIKVNINSEKHPDSAFVICTFSKTSNVKCARRGHGLCKVL